MLLSLIPLLAPYELIIVPDWDNYLNPYFLFVLIISIGSLAVSGFLVWAAIAGINSMMHFDKPRQMFIYQADAPVMPIRKVEVPIATIRAFEIETHDWSEGSPSYSFKVVMKDGHEYSCGSSWSKTEIEEIKEQVERFLGQPARE